MALRTVTVHDFGTRVDKKGGIVPMNLVVCARTRSNLAIFNGLLRMRQQFKRQSPRAAVGAGVWDQVTA